MLAFAFRSNYSSFRIFGYSDSLHLFEGTQACRGAISNKVIVHMFALLSISRLEVYVLR
jgi:hypothetical protein